MFRRICNELCINIRKKAQRAFAKIARFAAARAGLTILPPGFSMFNNDIAEAHGVDRAAIHHKLLSWQRYNERHHKQDHFRKGNWWTYGSAKWWQEHEFGWVSEPTIKRAFKDLREAGLLLMDPVAGRPWLCAIAAETVKLSPVGINLQLPLFKSDLEDSNRIPTIGKSTTSLSRQKSSKQKTPAPRKAAVAVFNIPEPRNNADLSRHESHDAEVEGRDMLADLPGELVDGWRDPNFTIGAFAQQYGAPAINWAWEEAATGFDNRIAGARTILKCSPAPSSALPPSPKNDPGEFVEGENPLFGILRGEPDEATQPDFDGPVEYPENETPPVDAPTAPKSDSERAWDIAYNQLEIQLDRASFETYLRGAKYLREEDGKWVIEAHNSYARDMLQHRLYRDIRRVVRDSNERGEVIELIFETNEVAAA